MSLTDYVRGHEAGLLQGQTVGESLERERIIKLLEEVLKFDSEQEKKNLFALIKGEQK